MTLEFSILVYSNAKYVGIYMYNVQATAMNKFIIILLQVAIKYLENRMVHRNRNQN